MTVCNMSIEAGAKAGLIAPDDTTFAYLEGRAHAPTGAAWDEAVAYWRTLATDDDATFDKEVRLDAAEIRPHVSWGTNPGQVAPHRRPRARPGDLRRPGERDAAERALEYMGLAAGTPMRGRRRRHRVHRLVHQQPHRGPAGRRRGGQGPPGRLGLRTLVVPGSWAVKAQAEAEGLDVVFTEAGFDWRDPGCSMCLAMNPDKLAARRAVRLDVEPQLRGPPGPGRAHPPRLPRRRRRHRHRRPLRHPRGPRRQSDERRPHRPGHRRAARPLRRRHRPDHPERLAQAGRAHRLREGPLLRVARRPVVRAERASSYAGATHPRGRPQLRHRLVARARRVGHPAVRLRGGDLAPLRRHLPQQLDQERPRAGRRVAPSSATRLLARDRGRPDARARRSTSSAACSRCRPSASSSRSRSTTRCGTGSSRASTTSASPSSTTPTSPPSRPTGPAWLPRRAGSSGQRRELGGVEPGVEERRRAARR